MDLAIVYLTKDAPRNFIQSVKMVKRQITKHEYRIIIIDSGSNERKLQLLKKLGLEIHKVKLKDFGFARTKNYALSLLRNEDAIMFLSQDCIPTNSTWLDKLANGLEGAVAAYCKQITGIDGKSTISTSSIYGNIDRIQKFPIKSIEDGFLSNACAIYRVNYLNKHNFPEWTYTNEDQIWAWKSILSGEKIKYVSSSAVYNHHNEKLISNFGKYFDHGNVTGILYSYLINFSENKKKLLREILNNLFVTPKISYIELIKLLGYFLGSKSQFLPNDISQYLSNYPHLRRKINVGNMRIRLHKIGMKIKYSNHINLN